MPRGCIHQAAAQEGDSAHLTISTYQRWSFADLLQARTACPVQLFVLCCFGLANMGRHVCPAVSLTWLTTIHADLVYCQALFSPFQLLARSTRCRWLWPTPPCSR